MTLKLITGGTAEDDRGKVSFVNDFDMSDVKRFYVIENASMDLVRGWRAHRIEQRWFYVLSGGFAIDVVKIDDWDNVDSYLPVEKYSIYLEDGLLLHIPAGYGTALQSLVENSKLLVFADFGLENAHLDNYTWSIDFFKNRMEIKI